MQVGDILLCSWGYEANISDFYRIIKRTATTVTVEQLKAETVGFGDFYDSRIVTASNELEYEIDYDWDNMVTNEFGQENPAIIKTPIIKKRKIKSYTTRSYNTRQGDYEFTREYIQINEYSRAYLWSGDKQIDYNHH
jgi:hypothetical protein